MLKVVLLLSLLILIFSPSSVYAANNIFGIHIINETDLEDAAKLVNSNGGEWGYVTLVIREDERDVKRWQNVFDKMRELKLIPIVRLATKPEGQFWTKPSFDEAAGWADFLNSLNWVVKDRYVVIFNEPNHANEWGGEINPEEYAQILKNYSQAFKANSTDFVILPSGLDAAAPNSKETMDMTDFVKRMYTTDNNIFTYIDGWNSHSYPNGFTASPDNSGRSSIYSFSWEVSTFSQYGLRQDIPIFITETGWKNNEDIVGQYFKDAYIKAWTDPRIRAVTPFILNYQGGLFADFSWKKQGENSFYPQYASVQSLEKTKGAPEQINDSIITGKSLPNNLMSDTYYQFAVSFKNTGQSIWDHSEGFAPSITLQGKNVVPSNYSLSHAKPGEISKVIFEFNSPENLGLYQLSVGLQHNGKPFGKTVESSINVVEGPKLQKNLIFIPLF